jgi:hypothetical protein
VLALTTDIDLKRGVINVLVLNTRYDWLKVIIDFVHPKKIAEIGVHNGARAWRMCEWAGVHSKEIEYWGFDLWELLEDHKEVYNGKGPSHKALAERELRRVTNTAVKTYLIQGDHETTVPEGFRSDLVFIDGDHRTFAIQRDYDRVKSSKVVVFDDHYSPEVEGMGANKVIVDHSYCCLLPSGDREKFSSATNRFMVATDNAALHNHLIRLGAEQC